MKRKELMKRALALSLSAVMAAGNIPVVTYANEVVQMEDEWELQTNEEDLSENEINAQEDIQGSEVQQAESDGEEIIQVEDSTLPEESIVIDNSVEETASPEIPVMDNEGTDSSEQTEEQQAAQAYLNENYIEKNKIISNGGDSVAKSTDGLTYRIGLKTPSGSSLTTLRLKYEGKTSQYKAGWYIDSEWVNVGTKKPADPGSVGINRPTAEQGEQTFTAKLRLFSADTNTETINDETQAATAALATQEFTIILEAAEPAYVMTVNVKDEAGNPVSDAEIILEKNFTKVTPRQDGSYDMEKGAQYTLTVKKDGYNDYKESNFTFNPTEVTTVKEVTLKKTVTKTINFTVTDQTTGKVIDNAKVTVKKGYSTEKPEEDGSYRLVEGTTYNYTVEAKNYKSVNSSFTVGDQQTIAVQLEKNISEYTVHINPTDKDGEQITNASITVTYEEEDPYDEYETITEELKVNADGTYTMKKGVTYTYTITAPDYVTVKDTYTPSGDKDTVSVPVKMVSNINPEDEKTVNAIKAKFDAEMGALRPNYATDKNVLDVVKNKIKAYGMDTTDVTITVKSSSDVERISTNGDIHYKKEQPDPYGNNSVNIGLVFAFEKNGAKAESKERTVTVCWDRDYFNEQMNKEKTDLTWNKIKGSNSSETEVTANLTLPQCMSNSTRTAWSKITWTSSDENVISLKDTGYGSLIDAKEGVIHAQPEDTEVTLTATFHANASLLNSYVEKESDFATLTKEFKVMVKGNGVALPTEQELKAILDQYYTADQIMESGTDTVADLTNCKTDLKLPRYTKIKDEEDNFVFNNKEIAVTSDVEALDISGFKVNVDRFASEKDIKANLIVTFTREGVTAKKTIPVTIKPITEAEVKSELDMMEAAKEHYFDGINDGRYKDKDSIIGNLHAFQEMIFDENGNPKWIYRSADQTGKGIIPDDMFTDSFEMEGAGYNKFKSSNHTVVAHESLLVTRRENDTQVTISSLLSSAAYKTSAEKHPDNTLLQKLYKQPVSVTVTVKGTKSAKENLETKLAEGKAFCDSIVEGNAAGQYPLGTKAKLQEAIEEAEKVLENAI